jgi:hypothetical protein
MLLALGSPVEPDAKCALEIVLEALYEEADTFAHEHTDSARGLALACRLKALKAFVSRCMAVTWTEGGAS